MINHVLVPASLLDACMMGSTLMICKLSVSVARIRETIRITVILALLLLLLHQSGNCLDKLGSGLLQCHAAMCCSH